MIEFKKLTKKLLLLGLPFFIFFEVIYRFDPLLKNDIETDYIASIIDKSNSIDGAKSPKIVVMGGSGSAYGICSDSLENRLKLPVYNQAIIFTFGINFMLNQIDSNLNKGDILIISPEYMMSEDGDYKDQLKAVRFFPKSRNYIQFKNMAVNLSEEIQFRLSLSKLFISDLFNHQITNYTINDSSSVFFRKGFNSKGDLVSHLNNQSTPLPITLFTFPEKYFKVIDQLNQFDLKLKKRGVKMFYSYPAYFKSGQVLNQYNLKLVENYIKKNANFTIIDSMESNIYEDSLFFDQGYHLNHIGRKIKSKTLSINVLKEINKRK